MFSYYLELALRSLKRSPGLTALMVFAIGLGVSASMTTYSVFRGVSGDPIPWKSARLFVPQIDIWGPSARGSDGEPPDALDYTDAMAMMRQHRATLQSAIYEISPSVMPTMPGQSPIPLDGYAVYSEFFPMLDVPFHYGSGWGIGDDASRSAVVVISDDLNQQVFGGVNSVGKTLNVEGSDYRVVGVLHDWNPQPTFYNVFGTGGFGGKGPDIFMPFPRAIASNLANGRTACNKEPVEAGFLGLQHSDCAWITYVAQLDDATSVQAYRRYLDSYARDQQKAGRFPWAPNDRLRDIPAYLDYEQIVPPDTRVSLLVALGLLVVCLVNVVGLLLAKFLRRSGEIGVRRALGASRAAIYAQFFTEASVIGLAGGVLGLLFTGLGVLSVSVLLPPRLADLARIDPVLLFCTLMLALVATLVAAVYPTFRAARVQPAWQLKSN